MKRVERAPTDIVAARKVNAGKIVDTDSLVSKYEILIKENEAGVKTEERSILLFQVLDQLIPHLGVFKPIISMIRQELYDYVFCSESHTIQVGDGNNAKLQRVPYYVLLNDQLKKRDTKSSDLQATIESLEQRLFEKHKQFEESMMAIADRNMENQGHEDDIEALQEEINEQARQIRQLEGRSVSDHKKFEDIKKELNRYCDSLQDDCTEKDNEIDYLSRFRQGYDDLDEAFLSHQAQVFQPPDSSDRYVSYTTREGIGFSTKKEHLVSDIQTSKKLEEQILTVMNTMIEQFDEFMENHKAEIASKPLVNNDDILDLRRAEREVAQADQELWSMQERFKATMEEVNSELELQRQHCLMLEEQLTTLDADDKKSKKLSKKKKQKEKAANENITLDEIKKMSLDPLDYIEEEYEENEFIPHERILSKYAVMLYYSQDGGKDWYLHQDCKYCDSCHEKTIACPHKVLGESKIILAPHRTTHLKLKRPSVKITKELPGRGKSMASAHVTLTSPTKTVSERATSVLTSSTSPAPFVTASSENQLVKMKHSLNETLDDFAVRTDIIRVIGRHLSIKRVKSLNEQFYAFVYWQDENSSDDDGYGSVLDNLYEFFSGRYLKEEAKFAAVHDFLSAVILYATDNRDIQLFAHSLVGNIDFAACRYILTLSNFIETIEWKDVEDFRAFATCVYPFIQDEDLEGIQMGYVSFSENKISKLHVFDYILYLTLKGREPRIQDLEQQLMQYPSREVGLMTYDEFCEAADHVLQIPNERIRRTLYCETLLLLQVSVPDVMHIHVSKLACILAHMQLMELTQKLEDTMYKFIEVNRPKHEEALGVHGHVVKVDPNIHLLTMHTVKNLSFNTARRDKFRRDRMETQSM